MEIWPAIDLRGGNCVRLLQGDYSRETVFGDDPAAMARRWVAAGAPCLHLVDLDGARDGRSVNREAIEAIVAAVEVPCELGGGIRDEETIGQMLDLGLTRLVIGTKALKDPAWFREMCRRFPGRLAVGIDARDGHVATDGWLDTSDVAATELAREISREPIAAIIYTDIAKDGMMSGPNLAAMDEMKRAVEVPGGRLRRRDDGGRRAAAGGTGAGRLHHRADVVRGNTDAGCGAWPQAQRLTLAERI